METFRDLPDLTLNLKDGYEDVYRLLDVIKPDWEKEQVNIQPLSGGHSCSTLRCYTDDENSITLRVRQNTEDYMRDPLLEQQVVKALASKGLFPPLKTTFQNGFCYESIPGSQIVAKDSLQLSIDEEQLRLIARQTADIHDVKIPDFNYSQTSYFEYFIDLLTVPCIELDGCPTMEELRNELRLVEEFVSSSVQSPLVLSQCHCHPANFIWNEAQRKVTFVDWELSQVAPRALDIASFFVSFDYFGFVYQIPTSIPDEAELQFCHHYLQRTQELQGNTSQDITEEELAQLLREIKYFKLVVKLVWVILNTKFFDAHSTAFAVNFQKIWDYNFGRYLVNKGELMGIKKLGKHEKTDQGVLKQDHETS